METCEHHDGMIKEMGKRPTTMSIWSVVGVLLGVCVIVLTTSFTSIRADVEKIQMSAEKIQAAVAQNTINMAVMQQDYKIWKNLATRN